MIFAAARIAIHFVDQLLNGVLAVADDLGRLTLRGGDQLVADHQQAKIAAGGVLFDDDARAFFASGNIRRQHLLARAQIRGHAAALIAVTRLDDHRQTNFGRSLPGFVGAFDRPAFRHRHANRIAAASALSSLSCAIISAIAVVRSVSDATMRRCFEPQPN